MGLIGTGRHPCSVRASATSHGWFRLAPVHYMENCFRRTTILALCHTHGLTYQIRNEYDHFAKFLPDVKVGNLCGETAAQKDVEFLSNKETHIDIIVCTASRIIVRMAGRINALVRDGHL
jgi:superfamily II DNA/RNA helicase